MAVSRLAHSAPEIHNPRAAFKHSFSETFTFASFICNFVQTGLNPNSKPNTCHQILKSLLQLSRCAHGQTSMTANRRTRDIPAQISIPPHMNPSLTNSRLRYQPLCTELRLGSLTGHWRPAGLNEYICLLNGLADWMFKKSVWESMRVCVCVCVRVCVEQM